MHTHIPQSGYSQSITPDIIDQFMIPADNGCTIWYIPVLQQGLWETYLRIFPQCFDFFVYLVGKICRCLFTVMLKVIVNGTTDMLYSLGIILNLHSN